MPCSVAGCGGLAPPHHSGRQVSSLHASVCGCTPIDMLYGQYVHAYLCISISTCIYMYLCIVCIHVISCAVQSLLLQVTIGQFPNVLLERELHLTSTYLVLPPVCLLLTESLS